MNLRFGKDLGSSIANTAFRAPTRGSETHPSNPLAQIREESSENSSESSFSEEELMASGSSSPMDQEEILRRGKFNSNPFEQSRKGLNFNVKLQFKYINNWGTDIYQDPLERFAFKTADSNTPFYAAPLVNYQGDLYIGSDGARYEVTEYPDRIDPSGVLRATPKNKTTPPPDADVNTSRANPNASMNTEAQEKAGLDNLFGNMHVDESDFGTQWTYVQHFSVFRINQDSSWQEVFRDSNGSFYTPQLSFRTCQVSLSKN